MKALIFAMLTISSSAFALSPTSSWTSIFSDHQATYKTAYDGQLNAITLDNACFAGAQIKSIKPVSICLKSVSVPGTPDTGPAYETRCVQSAMKDIAVATAYQRNVCAKYVNVSDGDDSHLECVETSTVQTVIPQTIKVTVWETIGDTDTFPGFEKSYTLPACQ